MLCRMTKEAERLQNALRTMHQECDNLRAQVQRLTSTRQRQDLLDQLPALGLSTANKSGAKQRASNAAEPGQQLLALCHQLEREPLHPKAGSLLQKVIQETQVWRLPDVLAEMHEA